MKKIEIFRAGKHTARNGNTLDYSISDLDQIVETYKPATEGERAPLVIGHPDIDAPAYGWVDKVWREGKSLFASATDLVEGFADLVEKKTYPNRSVALKPVDGKLTLRHIGFLGGHPPAIKGLAAVQFAEDSEVLEFADWDTAWALKSVGRIMQGLRDYFIDKSGLEVADKMLPQYDIDSLKTIQGEVESAYSEPEGEDMTKIEQLEADLAAEKVKTAEFAARAEAAETKILVIEAEKQTAEFSEFCDKQIAAGKVLQAEKPAMLMVLSALAKDSGKLEFGEGDAKVTKSALEAYMESIEAKAKVLEFGESYTADRGTAKRTSNADAAIHEKTEAKAKEKNIPYNDALRLVFAENPDLVTSLELESASA